MVPRSFKGASLALKLEAREQPKLANHSTQTNSLSAATGERLIIQEKASWDAIDSDDRCAGVTSDSSELFRRRGRRIGEGGEEWSITNGLETIFQDLERSVNKPTSLDPWQQSWSRVLTDLVCKSGHYWHPPSLMHELNRIMKTKGLACIRKAIRPPFHGPLRFNRRSFSAPNKPPPRTRTRARLEKLNQSLPSFLQRYTAPLLDAPFTYIASFLILHEITAVVPLFGLVGLFHYGNWLPSLGSDQEKGAISEGVRKFGSWFRKRQWVQSDITEEKTLDFIERDVRGNDTNADTGVRLVLEFATAYAITKALLPLRIIISACATPWFAKRFLGPLEWAARRIWKK